MMRHSRCGSYVLVSLVPLLVACGTAPEPRPDDESVGAVEQRATVYSEQGPLQELGDELTTRLTGPTAAFDIALFSDCHLIAPVTTSREDELRKRLNHAASAGAKLVWGLGDYGPWGNNAPPTLNHQTFNQILDEVLGVPASRSPEIALMTGNHDWYDGVGKALTMQTPYNVPLNLQGTSNERYLYYSFVVGDPNGGPAVGLISLDAGATGVANGKAWILSEELQAEQLHWMHQESVRFRKMGLPIPDPHVESVPVLDFRRQAFRRPVSVRRGDAMDPFEKHRSPELKGHGKGVLNIGRCELPGLPGGSGIDKIRTGGHVVDKAELRAGVDREIALDEGGGDLHGLLESFGRRDVCVFAGAIEAGDVILHQVGLAVEGSEEIRNRRPDHDAQVVDRKLALRCGDKLAVEVGKWLLTHCETSVGHLDLRLTDSTSDETACPQCLDRIRIPSIPCIVRQY